VLADGVISTDDEEYRISFAPDGQTAYFARGSGFFPQTREATIMETRLVDGEWSQPTTVAFSGDVPGHRSVGRAGRRQHLLLLDPTGRGR
jgi:hypothetical protein